MNPEIERKAQELRKQITDLASELKDKSDIGLDRIGRRSKSTSPPSRPCSTSSSYPSLFSSVISVPPHEGMASYTYYYNVNPPVEFGAPGIVIEVAWNKGQYLTCTGNSFAAPHIAGITSLIRSKHPELTPFQIKTVLLACAANTKRSR